MTWATDSRYYGVSAGDSYTGMWAEDKMHGQGTMTYADEEKIDGLNIKSVPKPPASGEWEANVYQGTREVTEQRGLQDVTNSVTNSDDWIICPTCQPWSLLTLKNFSSSATLTLVLTWRDQGRGTRKAHVYYRKKKSAADDWHDWQPLSKQPAGHEPKVESFVIPDPDRAQEIELGFNVSQGGNKLIITNASVRITYDDVPGSAGGTSTKPDITVVDKQFSAADIAEKAKNLREAAAKEAKNLAAAEEAKRKAAEEVERKAAEKVAAKAEAVPRQESTQWGSLDPEYG